VAVNAITDPLEGARALHALVARAQRILVVTGAGVSTNAGIPDYRGPQGVWNTRRPVPYDEFIASEKRRLDYWQQKREDHEVLCRAHPTATHRALATFEATGRLVALVTQNIDGLHVRASREQRAAGGGEVVGGAGELGSTDGGRAGPPLNIIELHGTALAVECLRCKKQSAPADAFAVLDATGAAPRCACGGLLKPATISFGQPLRDADLVCAIEAAEAADLALALGTTLEVEPAARIPLIARGRGASYAIVNRGPTAHDELCDLRIEADLDAVVPTALGVAQA
jgi:NAD-dependent deacetylase